MKNTRIKRFNEAEFNISDVSESKIINDMTKEERDFKEVKDQVELIFDIHILNDLRMDSPSNKITISEAMNDQNGLSLNQVYSTGCYRKSRPPIFVW